MSVTHHEIRPGAYADSIVLMHLQSSLAALPGVEDAGVVMGTAANLELLAANGLLASGVEAAAADDLVLVVRAASGAAAAEALSRVDELLAGRRTGTDAEFRPHSLRSATRLLPQASWVLISVPGRYAAAVADEALDRGKHVFLYSDNVSLEDEVGLKRKARDLGLLVMGPDCGTAVIGGTGLGFANRVRPGAIGLIGASGTGLQAVTAGIHAAGGGVSHAIGTGGRDLYQEVAGITALQGLDLLRRDETTEVIVLISKPPAPAVAARLLAAARGAGKPVVVQFLGHPSPPRRQGNLHFSSGLSETAALAVSLALGSGSAIGPEVEARSGYLRGLFAGGTLALEAQQALAGLTPLYSNAPILGSEPVADLATSRGHTILDLGADEFTVGRLHPMMDQDLRLRRLRQEGRDPEVGLILLDVILGEGSHPDPAAELGPAIEGLESTADVVVLMVGTDQDPQELDRQRRLLEAAGARVFEDVSEGLAWTAARLGEPSAPAGAAVELASLAAPLAAINVGLDSFYDSLVEQGAEAVQLDWRPPAGGDERLMALLERMR